ncbi:MULTISPECIES: hypothetical protein [unclassified Streptomyces]|uniref:hypothetical protein n=1 Tax=unclassified Streptomyces TaxID=2593676 RepID=UPI000710B985|nr:MULTISPECIES: hypothetical protein [unclassified Streptomyces]KRD20990.1 hypothetical protein ASE41_15895 [Streptomyces sp. Root264]
MTYVVTVDTCIPEGTPEMDPLQRAGAVALIEDGFDSVRSVRGPEGVEVALLDTIVAVHPGGALLKVIVDAPALEFAEDTVQALVDEVLERSALLADWTIERCEVELHQDLAEESLDAAEGPDAPPDDLAVRKARHTAGPSGGGPAEGDDVKAQAAAVRARMLGLAEALRSFPPAAFGAPGAADAARPEYRGAAGLAAGALVHATDILVDKLFEDLQVLTQEDAAVAECEGPLWHLEHLPDRYALQYDARFARRFLVTVIALTTRFTDGSFQRLSCAAEGLALRLLLNETTTVLERYGLLDDDVSTALDAFADRVYEGTDHQWLYDDALGVSDGASAGAGPRAAPLAFRSWFTPYDEGGYAHPSTADDV